MVYCKLHPLSPGMEAMLAQLTDVLARVNGNDTDPTDFLIQPKENTDGDTRNVKS